MLGVAHIILLCLIGLFIGAGSLIILFTDKGDNRATLIGAFCTGVGAVISVIFFIDFTGIPFKLDSSTILKEVLVSAAVQAILFLIFGGAGVFVILGSLRSAHKRLYLTIGIILFLIALGFGLSIVSKLT